MQDRRHNDMVTTLMDTGSARTLTTMFRDVGVITRAQWLQIRNKLNELDAIEARRNAALDNDTDIWGVGGQG